MLQARFVMEYPTTSCVQLAAMLHDWLCLCACVPAQVNPHHITS
jgi:hypothetical protein